MIVFSAIIYFPLTPPKNDYSGVWLPHIGHPSHSAQAAARRVAVYREIIAGGFSQKRPDMIAGGGVLGGNDCRDGV